MIPFESTFEVAGDNLNSLFIPDAFVSSSAAAGGSIFNNVDDALGAGKKNIAVADGDYPAFHADTPCRIVGIPPIVPSGTSIISGARFYHQCYIESHDVRIENLGFDVSLGWGLRYEGAYARVQNIDCVFTPGTAATGYGGISLRPYYGNQVIRCRFFGGTKNGILVYPYATTGTISTLLAFNWVYNCEASGIRVANFTGSTEKRRFVQVIRNEVRDCATVSGSGIELASGPSCEVTGNLIWSNGDSGVNDANGIYVSGPTTSPRTLHEISGNMIFDNEGYGIRKATNAGDAIVMGNRCFDNGAGDYYYVSNAPGVDLSSAYTYGTNIN